MREEQPVYPKIRIFLWLEPLDILDVLSYPRGVSKLSSDALGHAARIRNLFNADIKKSL